MSSIIFIIGIGTGVGKTLVSAIVCEALQADYWKPIQAGLEDGTDAAWVRERISNNVTTIHPELYRLQLPASPHLAARKEGITISIDQIVKAMPTTNERSLVVEGAGGLLVPLNDKHFVADLVKACGAQTLLVSRNYLGSINHSLLTAMACRQYELNVAGWIFNDHFMNYEQEITNWSKYPSLGSVPLTTNADWKFVQEQAQYLRPLLQQLA
jgi:dethiobiotin synthetase